MMQKVSRWNIPKLLVYLHDFMEQFCIYHEQGSLYNRLNQLLNKIETKTFLDDIAIF